MRVLKNNEGKATSEMARKRTENSFVCVRRVSDYLGWEDRVPLWV